MAHIMAGPVYAWRPDWRSRVRNRFLRNPGDELGPDLARFMLGQRKLHLKHWQAPASRLLTVGSILQHSRDGDVIWGSGLYTPDEAHKIPRELDVRAVRGPLTAEVLRKQNGVDCTVFGDPGLLVGDMYPAPAKPAAGGKPLLILHYADKRVFPGIRTIRMVGSPARIMRAIHKAEVIISSALHGIIMAEAVGKPAVWLSGLGHEPDFKYLDYFRGTGREAPLRTADPARWNDCVNPPITTDLVALRKAFPYDRFALPV